jgi:DNA-directed RNA polymerase subunit RPC12/RpoP
VNNIKWKHLSMNAIQKFFTSILPKSSAQNMEDESRKWMLTCSSCGYKASVWELGGIRWKAYGNPQKYRRCPECGKFSWMTVTKEK